MKKYLLIIVALFFAISVKAQDSTYFRANEWSSQIEAYHKSDSIKYPEKYQILFVGSSSIRMWKNIESYFPGYPILSRGFGGAWMSDVLYHMQTLVLNYKPKQIVLYAGENDLSNGKTPEALLEDVKTFVRMTDIHLPGVPILLLSVKPSPFSSRILNKQHLYNLALSEYANTKKQLQYIDVASILLNDSGIPIDSFYMKDRLHMQDNAYKEWARIITPYLKK